MPFFSVLTGVRNGCFSAWNCTLGAVVWIVNERRVSARRGFHAFRVFDILFALRSNTARSCIPQPRGEAAEEVGGVRVFAEIAELFQTGVMPPEFTRQRGCLR
jgi:hypothetical protein